MSLCDAPEAPCVARFPARFKRREAPEFVLNGAQRHIWVLAQAPCCHYSDPGNPRAPTVAEEADAARTTPGVPLGAGVRGSLRLIMACMALAGALVGYAIAFAARPQPAYVPTVIPAPVAEQRPPSATIKAPKPKLPTTPWRTNTRIG